jgi:hypothetical protein
MVTPSDSEGLKGFTAGYIFQLCYYSYLLVNFYQASCQCVSITHKGYMLISTTLCSPKSNM